MRFLPSPRPGLVLLLLAGLALSGCQACSSTEQAGPVADAASEHAGSWGGTGGMPRAGGSGGTSSDGAAGSDGGSDGPIEAGGPEPVWEEIGETAGIIFDRVSNTSELSLFRWGPCEEGSMVVDGCESAEFLIPAFYGDELELSPGSVVHDNGSQVFAGLMFFREADYVIVYTVELSV